MAAVLPDEEEGDLEDGPTKVVQETVRHRQLPSFTAVHAAQTGLVADVLRQGKHLQKR